MGNDSGYDGRNPAATRHRSERRAVTLAVLAMPRADDWRHRPVIVRRDFCARHHTRIIRYRASTKSYIPYAINPSAHVPSSHFPYGSPATVRSVPLIPRASLGLKL